MAEINPIEETLGRIEVGIRQLKVQYDMFFSGVIPRQPLELRKDLEILIKTLGNTAMQRFSDRYRYNALASKYQTMVELWNKMIRAKEEGRLRPGIPGFVQPIRRNASTDAAEPAAEQPAAPAPAPPREATNVVFRQRVTSPQDEDGSLTLFYDRYLEASRAGGGEPRVTYKQFVKQIAARTEAMRKKAGCGSVMFSIVVKDGGVTLKAAPADGRSET